MKKQSVLNEQVDRMKDLMKTKSVLKESTLSAPLTGSLQVTSPFGQKRKYETHPGVDLRAVSGTQLLSPADGTVVLADPNNNPKCGGTLDVQFGDGFWARFCHIKSFSVKNGDKVKKGQVLGLTGGNANDPGHGNSTDAHLHFTLKKDGRLVNPMDYIDKVNITSDGVSGETKKTTLSDLLSLLDGDKTSVGGGGFKELFNKILQMIFNKP
jgi:murein DD-endopeptidase MepM/ murein hydrolase activator NlpD